MFQPPGGLKNHKSTLGGDLEEPPVPPVPKNAATDNQVQVAELKNKLTEANTALLAREAEIQHQSTLLSDLENAVGEFQRLSIAKDQESRNTGGEQPTAQELELRTLLQDRERRLADVKAEFEIKRAEFRETIEALEQASDATSRVYERRIEELENKIDAAHDMFSQIGLLEANITELEKSLDESRIIEQQVRERLADSETKLSQKDREIAELNRLNMDSGAIGVALPSYSQDQAVREKLEGEIEVLEKMVETKVFREEELEREVESLRAQVTKLSKTASVPAMISNNVVESKNKVHLWCEMCESSGHDILDCKARFRKNAEQENVAKPVNGKKLWCALCERDGHSSMDCPYETSMF